MNFLCIYLLGKGKGGALKHVYESEHIVSLYYRHTCEPSDRRMNSPVFLGHLPISNILPNSPDFYMFLPNSPDFYMFLPYTPDFYMFSP